MYSEMLTLSDSLEERRLKAKIRRLELNLKSVQDCIKHLSDENFELKSEIYEHFNSLEDYICNPSISIVAVNHELDLQNFQIELKYNKYNAEENIRMTKFFKEWFDSTVIPKIWGKLLMQLEKE
jgi:hypothetical protein